MFNQQSQGVLTPQMVHMQRLMGNRPQRSAFFAAEMNSPMDDRQQHSLGISHSRNFGSGLGGQTSSVLRNFPNRVDMNNFSFGQEVMGEGCSVSQMGVGGGACDGGFIGSASARVPVFKCPECGIVKNSNEELEVHIKTEHLGWLPFQCPICTALRASDIQMREHIHSHHKKNENKYIYIDNPHSKRILQEMMDRSLFGASQQVQQMTRRNRALDAGEHPGLHGQSTVKKSRFNGPESGADPKTFSIGKRTNGLQSHQSQCDSGTDKKVQGEMNAVDDETDAQLSNIFGRRIKSEFDMAYSPDDEQQLLANEDEDNLPDDNSHQIDALQNMAAMFSASGGSDRGGQDRGSNGDRQQQRDLFQHRRIVRNRPGPMTSKKRVLGLCADCEKPITAGARQMHMFYHLGKDLNTYRFRCKHSGCKVQHYRKDQMENHQAKSHGKVDTDMMEDRSMELYNLVQDMSLKLLGTTGNTPGPTAAKAQLMYDQQMREMEASIGVRKRRRPGYENNTNNFSTSNLDKTSRYSSAGPGNPSYDSANRRVENLECRLCNKFILNRIRGFHILWHLNNDLGIVRYGCKYCNFKHDRPQSVAAHGSREHGDENACEDLLYNFESELKSMSKACFGVERLFEKEIRRRNKLERAHLNSLEDSPSDFLDDDNNSQQSNGSKQIGRRSQQIANLKIPLKTESIGRNWTQKEPVKKRRSGARRFGTRARRPMSRRARDVMVKLREVSMRLGGAQYFKKRSNEAVPCEKCGKLVINRLSDHAYSHMEGCDLFRCKQCNLGHYSRETIVRHLKDFHNSNEAPVDNRLRYAQEIKDAIRECYPGLFIDAPIPTKEDIEKLRAQLNLSDQVLVCEKDDDEHEDGEDDAEEGEQEYQEEDGGGEENEEVEEDEEAEDKSGDYDGEEDNGMEEDGELVEGDEEEEQENGGDFENGEEEEEDEDYEDDEEGILDEEEGETTEEKKTQQLMEVKKSDKKEAKSDKVEVTTKSTEEVQK